MLTFNQFLTEGPEDPELKPHHIKVSIEGHKACPFCKSGKHLRKSGPFQECGNCKQIWNPADKHPGTKLKEQNEVEPLVHRIDNERHDFTNTANLKTYHHTPDWTQSGMASPNRAVKSGFKKSTGLFAGQAAHVAPYAAPKGTSYIQHHDEHGKSHVFFNQKDKSAIQKHRPTLSSFPAARFKYLKHSGEHFSKNPGAPVSQTTINPLEHMKAQGHQVHFIPSLQAKSKELKKSATPYNAEHTDSWS